jgi:hypothetical protein
VCLIKLHSPKVQNGTRPRQGVTSEKQICDDVPGLRSVKQSSHFHRHYRAAHRVARSLRTSIPDDRGDGLFSKNSRSSLLARPMKRSPSRGGWALTTVLVDVPWAGTSEEIRENLNLSPAISMGCEENSGTIVLLWLARSANRLFPFPEMSCPDFPTVPGRHRNRWAVEIP